MQQPVKRDINIIIIRILALMLLVFAFVIAGVNYGAAKKWGAEARHAWHLLYYYFEYFFRGFTILLGSFLTWRFIKKNTGRFPLQRRIVLLSFSLTSLLLLVLWPLVTGYWEIYYALMPFPWSMLPFQLAITGKSFGSTLPGWLGIDAATLLIWAFLIFQVITFGGTIFLGRKWQCSMICLLNGCHAESLGAGLPFLVHDKKRPHSKQIHPRVRKVLTYLKYGLFALNMLLAALWTFYLVSGHTLLPEALLLRIENIKYLSLELTMLMVLWFLIGGRGYCFYCPAGFGIALVARLAGQRVETGLTHCTQCRSCNDACKMSIDIMSRAKTKQPVQDLSCVGCGLCMDSCPTGNLNYRTHLFRGW